MTGREIARLVPRGSQKGVYLVLKRLAEQGIAKSEEAGPAVLYRLNREHLAAPIAEALAQLRTKLIERLRDEIDDWELAPMHASVIGSAARGDGDTSSDIDVFIVRPAGVDEEDPSWRQQLDQLAERTSP